jgi:hypothetical protein
MAYPDSGAKSLKTTWVSEEVHTIEESGLALTASELSLSAPFKFSKPGLGLISYMNSHHVGMRDGELFAVSVLESTYPAFQSTEVEDKHGYLVYLSPKKDPVYHDLGIGTGINFCLSPAGNGIVTYIRPTDATISNKNQEAKYMAREIKGYNISPFEVTLMEEGNLNWSFNALPACGPEGPVSIALSVSTEGQPKTFDGKLYMLYPDASRPSKWSAPKLLANADTVLHETGVLNRTRLYVVYKASKYIGEEINPDAGKYYFFTREINSKVENTVQLTDSKFDPYTRPPIKFNSKGDSNSPGACNHLLYLGFLKMKIC